VSGNWTAKVEYDYVDLSRRTLGLNDFGMPGVSIDPRIHLIAGGLHLVVASDSDTGKIVTALHDTHKVQYIAPGHCTGEPAFTALRKTFGDRYLFAGLGSTVR